MPQSKSLPLYKIKRKTWNSQAQFNLRLIKIFSHKNLLKYGKAAHAYRFEYILKKKIFFLQFNILNLTKSQLVRCTIYYCVTITAKYESHIVYRSFNVKNFTS